MVTRASCRKCAGLLGGTLALAVVLGILAPAAQAALVMDLRTSTGGTSQVITRAMATANGGTGTNITLNVWANVTGADGLNNEKLGYTYYSVESSATSGGALSSGGVTAAVIQSPFTATPPAIAHGKVQDLNADGVVDLGSNDTASNPDFAKPRAGTPATAGNGTGERVDNNTWRWNVEEITFHVPGLSGIVPGSGKTTMTVVIPSWSAGVTKGANWYQDSNGMLHPANNTYAAGTGVEFTLEATAVGATVIPDSYNVPNTGSTDITGSATITAGFGSLAGTGWDFNNDGTVDQAGNTFAATHDYLTNQFGYVGNVPHLATFIGSSNDGVLGSDTVMITLLPEPATMALVGLGLAAVAGRRRARR